jgi:hypothetical protein
MLTLKQYKAYEDNVAKILAGGVNTQTGVPFDIVKVDRNLDLSFEEHFSFQETQAWAHVSGVIDPDVARIIYAALGESMSSNNGGWIEGVTTARKQAITQLMSELLAKKIAALKK